MIKLWRHNWTSAARQYSGADAIVVSVGKSGRTWLRVFLYSYFCALDNREFTLDNRKLAGSNVPKVVFTHDWWGYATTRRTRNQLRGKHLIPRRATRTKPILLLVRDPRDLSASLFFQITKRSHFFRGDLSEMIRHPQFGIESIVEIMNRWINEWGNHDNFKFIRYEDSRNNPEASFRSVLTFFGFSGINESIFAQSLQFSSFDNMKKLEASGKDKTGILTPGDLNDPNSFKVRRGVVGGYKDYFSSADIDFLNRTMVRLDPRYGYGK